MRRRSFLFGVGALAIRATTRVQLGSIAYIQPDGLWVRDLPAGKPVRLINARNLQEPRFSASGKWISCVDGTALHVLSRDGEIHTIPQTDAQWSPLQDELITDNNQGLRIYSASNGWSTPIAGTKAGETPVLVSADAMEIVYADALPGTGPTDRTGRLCRLNWKEPEAQPIVLRTEQGSGLVPCAWSSSTDAVLYWVDEDFSASLQADGLALFRISASGGTPRTIDTTLVHGDMVALSPDQKSLAITAGAGREEWGGKRIAIVDLRSNNLSYLTPPEIAAVCPTWSPHGDHIAFSAAPVPPGVIAGGDPVRQALQKRRIWIAAANGNSKLRQVTNDPRYRDEEPIWSRDGTHTLFCRIDDAGQRTIWLLNLSRPDDLLQVAGPLATLQNEEAWFGYYGYINWRSVFDWYT